MYLASLDRSHCLIDTYHSRIADKAPCDHGQCFVCIADKSSCDSGQGSVDYHPPTMGEQDRIANKLLSGFERLGIVVISLE